MATAQQMPAAGPRSARLADDAATAALYATHPRRLASVRDATTTESQYSDHRGIGGASNLSAASAGAALAHANRKSVEIWQPGPLTEAEKAAVSVKNYTSPEVPRPSSQYSAEGLGAAMLAVRAQRAASGVSPTPDISVERSQMQTRALRAASDAYTTRRRAGSVPTEPVIATESPEARSAAGASRRARVEVEEPLDHLDSALEASRIQHAANANARLYTSSPPIASEVEERNRRNSMHAAAISMAKDMYDITGSRDEAGDRSSAIYAAQRGRDRTRVSKTISEGDGTAGQRALTLQDAAQKRAAEKLARMQDENTELQNYYGTAPQAPRSRFAVRRKRTSSEADATQTDAEQSRQIRNQMFSLRTKLNEVDERRQQDRDLLMKAARRNVDATIHDMEMKLYADTGRAPPSVQKQWEEAAQARAHREAEAAEATVARKDRVNIGAEHYMDMADVEAVARTRVQPALDEIEDKAERRRAQEVEARLDAEEQQRQVAIEREREAERRAVEKQEKAPEKREKREPKGFNLLRRLKSKRAPTTKAEPEHEEAARPPAEAAPVEVAAAEAGPAEEVPAQEAPVTQEAAAPQENIREARAVETIAPPLGAAHQVAPEDADTPGASMVFAAGPAPIGAPVRLVTTPSGPNEQPGTERFDGVQRDAAATGATVSAMHTIRPITSPRADSKLKSWFRDRLARRSAGPISAQPHQATPVDNTETEVGFAGGAALTGRSEPRGAALGSHPVTGADIEADTTSYDGNNGDVAQTNTEEPTQAYANGHGDKNGDNKRSRLRRSFMKTVSLGSSENKTNGTTHARKSSEAIPASESKGTGTDLQGLRDSAAEQGLPVPPPVRETVSAGRESRFSEDL